MTDQADITAAMLSALEWQIELGADEAIGEQPVNRFDEPAAKPKAPVQQLNPASVAASPSGGQGRGKGSPAPESAVPDTAALAASANSLEELAQVMADWDGTPLKAAARKFVFCDGLPGAHLMIVGEAPGQEEDRQGKPFVGRAGQLLDRMLAAIGRSRTETDPAKAAYITNMLPWRPVGNRTPTPEESALFLPFVIRHIQLAKPKLILTMGNTPTKAMLDTTTGIKRMRGNWVDHQPTGLRLLPTFHPAYLLRQPADKKLAWQDLLSLKAALESV